MLIFSYISMEPFILVGGTETSGIWNYIQQSFQGKFSLQLNFEFWLVLQSCCLVRETYVPGDCNNTRKGKLKKALDRDNINRQCKFQILSQFNFALFPVFLFYMNSSTAILLLQYKKDKRGGFSLGISVRGLIVYEVSALRSSYLFNCFNTPVLLI